MYKVREYNDTDVQYTVVCPRAQNVTRYSESCRDVGIIKIHDADV